MIARARCAVGRVLWWFISAPQKAPPSGAELRIVAVNGHMVARLSANGVLPGSYADDFTQVLERLRNISEGPR